MERRVAARQEIKHMEEHWELGPAGDRKQKAKVPLGENHSVFVFFPPKIFFF